METHLVMQTRDGGGQFRSVQPDPGGRASIVLFGGLLLLDDAWTSACKEK